MAINAAYIVLIFYYIQRFTKLETSVTLIFLLQPEIKSTLCREWQIALSTDTLFREPV